MNSNNFIRFISNDVPCVASRLADNQGILLNLKSSLIMVGRGTEITLSRIPDSQETEIFRITLQLGSSSDSTAVVMIDIQSDVEAEQLMSFLCLTELSSPIEEKRKVRH